MLEFKVIFVIEGGFYIKVFYLKVINIMGILWKFKFKLKIDRNCFNKYFEIFKKKNISISFYLKSIESIFMKIIIGIWKLEIKMRYFLFGIVNFFLEICF